MEKTKYKKKTFEERKEEVDALINEMEALIPTYFESPEDMREHLDFMAQIHNYSARNKTLVRKQFMGAVAVASFGKWKEEGFSVRKGEKGIKILVPNEVKYIKRNLRDIPVRYANKEEKQLIDEKKIDTFSKIHYSIGYVFDISQTNAKASDLPKVFPNKWIEGTVENYGIMMESMEKLAKDMNVSFGEPFEELGTAKGAFYFDLQNGTRGHIGLNPRNSELQNVKTMIHELAHAELHYGKKTNLLKPVEQEFQAEMVAYSVASYFGLDTKEYSLKYLNDWTDGKKLKDQQNLLQDVSATSCRFINAIEQDLALAKEREDSMEIITDKKEMRKRIGDWPTIQIQSEYEYGANELTASYNNQSVTFKSDNALEVAYFALECEAIDAKQYKNLYEKLENEGFTIQFNLDEEIHTLLTKSEKGFLNKDHLVKFGKLIDSLPENYIKSVSFDFDEKFKKSVALGLSGRPIDKETESPFIQRACDFIGYESLEAHLLKVGENLRTISEEEENILLVEFEALSNSINESTSVEGLKSLVDEEIKRLSDLREWEESRGIRSSMVLGRLEKGLQLTKENYLDEKYIKGFNEFFEGRYAAIDEGTLDSPSILVQWSEHDSLKSNTIKRYKEANEYMERLERESQNDLGYYKTRYHLLIPNSLTEDGKVQVLNMDRLDIGDGYYKNPHEQILKERKLPEKLREVLNAEIGVIEVSKDKVLVKQEKEHER